MTLQTRFIQTQFHLLYFRARIPGDLRPYLGKTEEKFSLRTRGPVQARRLARQASVDLDEQFESLRGQH